MNPQQNGFALLVNLNFNEIGNEQRSAMLIYIIKKIFALGRRRKAFLLCVLLTLTFNKDLTHHPKDIFLFCGWWMLCGAMMTISKMCRGQSYSWISSPTRLDPSEIVYTRGVYKASVGNIQSKLLRDTERSLLAYLNLVFGKIMQVLLCGD